MALLEMFVQRVTTVKLAPGQLQYPVQKASSSLLQPRVSVVTVCKHTTVLTESTRKTVHKVSTVRLERAVHGLDVLREHTVLL